MRLYTFFIVIASLLVAVVTTACGTGTAGPTTPPPTSSPAAAPTLANPTTLPSPSPVSVAPSPTATTTPSSTAAVPTTGDTTAGQLAAAGKTVFADKCAKCHGENGQGLTAPANIGPSANLAKFGTAGGLFDYVTLTMPQDAPGSLTQQEYLQAVSYLLVANQFVQADMQIDTNALPSIPLTK